MHSILDEGRRALLQHLHVFNAEIGDSIGCLQDELASFCRRLCRVDGRHLAEK
jgi:hypothetical protein